ncbi:MAG: branched-chain amino acid ABC transporter permease [Planctomycetes bacterium]|nr:branched-chain amino acid ABC transporter permease [Planctomycetota bacterium]
MFSQLLVNGVTVGSIYGLTALGFAIIYRTARFFHFAHGAVYAVGAYVAYSVVLHWGWSPLVAFFLAGITAACVGVGIEVLVYDPLRRQKAPTLVFLIASFGVFVVVQNLLQLIYGAQILTIRTGPVKEGRHVLGAVITDMQVLILAASSVIGIGAWLLVQQTRLGKATRAVADDRLGASAVGINPERIIMLAFGIGSALAGVAGMLVAYETNIEPTMGMNAILKGMIASIIGGIGSIPGAMIGGLFLGIGENIGIWKISAGWKDAIAFAILIVFLLVRPSGIMGVKVRGEWL